MRCAILDKIYSPFESVYFVKLLSKCVFNYFVQVRPHHVGGDGPGGGGGGGAAGVLQLQAGPGPALVPNALAPPLPGRPPAGMIIGSGTNGPKASGNKQNRYCTFIRHYRIKARLCSVVASKRICQVIAFNRRGGNATIKKNLFSQSKPFFTVSLPVLVCRIRNPLANRNLLFSFYSHSRLNQQIWRRSSRGCSVSPAQYCTYHTISASPWFITATLEAGVQ